MSKTTNERGFTLIELIIVIAIIAILAGAIFVAVDPARRLNEARNARRATDVENVLDALVKYQADNNGTQYSAVPAANGIYYVIGTGGAGACADADCGAVTNSTDCVDLSALPANYLGSIPEDPSTGTAANTDYYIMRGTTGALTVGACDPQGEGSGGSGDAPSIESVR